MNRASERTTRWLAVGGVVGPAWFIAAWSILGQRRQGYSPIAEPISRLAAVGAGTQPAMTVGLCVLGAGVGAYAVSLRSVVSGRAALAAATTSAASFGVAALPLGSRVGGTPHAVAAGIAYASLAATPLLAARPLRDRGLAGAAQLSIAAGLTSALALVGSATLETNTGLLQRTGLTVGHLWIAASAVWVLRRHANGAWPRRSACPSRRACAAASVKVGSSACRPSADAPRRCRASH